LKNSKTYDELLKELNSLKENQQKYAERELDLLKKNEELTYQLEEANDTLEAIRHGEIDALVVKNGDDHVLFTLKNADQTYRIFIEQMTQGALTLNPNGIIVYSNSQFAAMIGLPLEKVIGQSLFRFIVDEDIALFKELIESAWNEIYTRGEIKLKNINQDLKIPTLLSLKTLNLDEGQSLSIILTDLTSQKSTQNLLQEKNAELEAAQKETKELNSNLETTVKDRTRDLEATIQQKNLIEKALRNNEDRLTKILETMAEGVIICETNGDYTYANPMAQKLIGIQEMNGMVQTYFDPKWPRLKIDGSPLPINEHPIRMALTDGKTVYDYEIAIQVPNAERIYISINTAVLKNINGDVILCIATFMDVTNRRKIYQQKDEFISVASHELKTPITSLKASLQLLKRLKDTEHTSMIPKLIDQANKSMNKVSILIEDLLNTSQYNSGQLHLHTKNINLYELIYECCKEIRTEGKYSIKIEGDKEIFVNADPDKIEQVIVNFVNNAIKYASDSNLINIEIVKEDDMVKVAIIDKGPGIDPSKTPHLFDRYYRGDNDGKQYSGLGLGLYICAEIIKKHNGKIGVESILNSGSTFWFKLPIIT